MAKLQKIDRDLSTAMLEIGQKSWKEYAFQYSMGASFKENNVIIAWFNNEMVHISPIALNLVHMSIIRSIAGHEYSIQITNEPLEIRIQDEINDQELLRRAESTFEFLFPFIIFIIMAILSAKYTSFYIEVCLLSHFYSNECKWHTKYIPYRYRSANAMQNSCNMLAVYECRFFGACRFFGIC